MWSTQRNLSNLINNVIANRKYDQYSVFEEELNKNFNNFLDILKYAVIISYFFILY
jgi:hypothetical protein